MDLVTVLLLVGGGIVAGFVNTVAGGGSVVTLPLLTEILGDSVLANGTNRIAILLQNVAGVAAFRRGGALPFRRTLPFFAPVILGALAGAWVAAGTPDPTMKKVFAVVLVLVALSVVVKPSRWLGGTEARLREPWRFLVFLGAGFYGGFVQAGVGFLLLAPLVLGAGYDLVKGNAAKLLLVLVYTPLCLVLFAWAAKVDLRVGLVLACGNVTGALLATTLAVKKGGGWIRWVLVVAAVGAALRMLLV